MIGDVLAVGGERGREFAAESVTMKQTDWYGLYSESWSDDIVPDAYSHPAKYARGLIRQIYRHALERGYLQPGDHIVDPFGGVALGSFDAARYGLNWTGVELEEKFVTLGNANIDLWRGRYAPHFPGWGTARLLQGDSRQLCRVIGEAAAVVSSPPFESGLPQQDRNFTAPHDSSRNMQDAIYGSDPANIGNDQGETFWSAAALIVAQVHQVLKPGGVAIWVTGDFVRRRQRVLFGEQWVALCESLGFVAIEHIRAWKTEHNGTQLGMFGEDKHHRTDRVSFFRRLANEKNPDNAILNEDVWIMVKQ